jgi:hypothetical protein
VLSDKQAPPGERNVDTTVDAARLEERATNAATRVAWVDMNWAGAGQMWPWRRRLRNEYQAFKLL